MEQTKVTTHNSHEFYQQVYPTVGMSYNQLINLTMYPGIKVLFDCAGWYYANNFIGEDIVKYEYIQTCKNYGLTRQQFDYLLNDGKLPSKPSVCNTLVLDHSAYLKYKNISELTDSLESLVYSFTPEIVLIRMNLINLNDSRLVDRFTSIAGIFPENYAVAEFQYCTKDNSLFVELIKKVHYDFN